MPGEDIVRLEPQARRRSELKSPAKLPGGQSRDVVQRHDNGSVESALERFGRMGASGSLANELLRIAPRDQSDLESRIAFESM